MDWNVSFFKRKKKFCGFCRWNIDYIDHQTDGLLHKFLNDRAKILPRRITGLCSKHQKLMAKAVKRSRIIAVVPFLTDNYRRKEVETSS